MNSPHRHDDSSAPPLVPLLTATEELTPALDALLTTIARRARAGDLAARNALYFALEAKIARFVRRYRYAPWSDDGRWDADDVGQEAFLVFVELISAWPGEGSFGPYFLSRFPWRLRDAVIRRLIRPCRFERSMLNPGDQGNDAANTETTLVLEDLAERFAPLAAAVLRAHIQDGEPFGRIAYRLGVNRRTVHRAWRAILAELRAAEGVALTRKRPATE